MHAGFRAIIVAIACVTLVEPALAQLPSRLGGRPIDMDLSDLAKKIAPLTGASTLEGGSTLKGSGITSLAKDCVDLPSTAKLYPNVKAALRAHKLTSAYESVVPTKITLYTNALIDEYEAVFYYYSADIFGCNRNGCSLSVTAVRVEAPLSDEDESILLSEAKWWNDHVAGDLVEAASPTALCRSK